MAEPLPIPAALARILAEAPVLARAYLVGGCVRDWLLGLAVVDYDVEVFGVGYEELARGLACFGRTDLVGRAFGVVKLTTPEGATYDFTVPRRDSKVAPGHKGFQIATDPALAPAEAVQRRDFTINALMLDPRSGRLLDFVGGARDLDRRVLRHVSPAFSDDPLRVLRGMQFAGRFDLGAAPETLALCRAMAASHDELAVERVWEEWRKWAARSTAPSAGLRFLADSGWIVHYPEVDALRGTPQDPDWHPEGDVFVHTGHCLDALVRLPQWRAADEASRVAWSLAALAHDFGKPSTTHAVMRGGRRRIASPGHDQAGVPLAERFLARINAPRAVRERVPPLVADHLVHLQPLSDRGVRRLARRLAPETIDGLAVVMVADHMGRPPKPAVVPESVSALLDRAADLAVARGAPQPVLMGRHLIGLGMAPGKDMGALLAEAYEAQLDGSFADLAGAFAWLATRPLPAPLRAAVAREAAAR